jgi:hypothetical protein
VLSSYVQVGLTRGLDLTARLGPALTLTLTLRLPLTSRLKRVLLLLNSRVPIQTGRVEVDAGSLPTKSADRWLSRHSDIHTPDHILLGVRQVVRIQRTDDILPWVLVSVFTSVWALLGRLVPASLQLRVQEASGEVGRGGRRDILYEILGISRNLPIFEEIIEALAARRGLLGGGGPT